LILGCTKLLITKFASTKVIPEPGPVGVLIVTEFSTNPIVLFPTGTLGVASTKYITAFGSPPEIDQVLLYNRLPVTLSVTV